MMWSKDAQQLVHTEESGEGMVLYMQNYWRNKISSQKVAYLYCSYTIVSTNNGIWEKDIGTTELTGLSFSISVNKRPTPRQH